MYAIIPMSELLSPKIWIVYSCFQHLLKRMFLKRRWHSFSEVFHPVIERKLDKNLSILLIPKFLVPFCHPQILQPSDLQEQSEITFCVPLIRWHYTLRRNRHYGLPIKKLKPEIQKWLWLQWHIRLWNFNKYFTCISFLASLSLTLDKYKKSFITTSQLSPVYQLWNE